MLNNKSMVGIKSKETYKYGQENKAVLTNEVEVTATEVVISDGKVISVPSADVKIGERYFYISVWNDTYSINNCPDDIDGKAIKDEFIAFVEADVKSK